MRVVRYRLIPIIVLVIHTLIVVGVAAAVRNGQIQGGVGNELVTLWLLPYFFDFPISVGYLLIAKEPYMASVLTPTLYHCIAGGIQYYLLVCLVLYIRERIVIGRRRRQNVCTKCGYILQGLTEPRCPECGELFDPKILPPQDEPHDPNKLSNRDEG